MKLFLFVILIFFGGTMNLFSYQDMNSFFEETAIIVPSKQVSQYIYGDNIAGYFEGYTHAYRRGQGYLMKQSTIYSDFASYVDNVLNNKKEGIKTKIYTYGIRTYYSDNIWDEFILLSKKYAIILNVHSDKKGKLSLLPITTSREDSTIIENIDNCIVFKPKKEVKNVNYPVYYAITSGKEFIYENLDFDARNELKDIIKMNKFLVRPCFTSKKDENDFNLIIAFGWTPEEAIEKAKNLAKTDSITEYKKYVYELLTKSILWTDDSEYNKALTWAKLSSYFMVVEEFGKGIWAGLPWFKDNWGRDTFISLPGTLIVSGQFDEAKSVITNFSTYQNRGILSLIVSYDNEESKEKAKDYVKNNFGKIGKYLEGKFTHSLNPYYLDHIDELNKKIQDMGKNIPGIKVEYTLDINKFHGRIPNRVQADNIIYNTTDGTPWFIREVYEYIRYTGDLEFAKSIYPVVKLAIEGAISNYVDNNGFLTHDDADTWMDARISGGAPWSARGNRAVEIQALWYVSLKVGSLLAQFNNDLVSAKEWDKISTKLKDNFLKYFWDNNKKIMADRVNKNDKPDFKARPNQLMLISVPFEDRFIPDEIGALVLKNSVSELLYPYGIASLSQNHPYFHPYHDGQANYHKDAAYHNGTVWGWNAGFTVTSLLRYGYIDFAYKLTKNLSKQILEMGCLGSMSELVDAIPDSKGNIKLSGTFAQAWSTAEFSRNGYQDYGGFIPDLINNKIYFSPCFPNQWNKVEAKFAFGNNSYFIVKYNKINNNANFIVSISNYTKPIEIIFIPTINYTKYKLSSSLQPDKPLNFKIDFSNNKIFINEQLAKTEVYIPSYYKIIGELDFVKPEIKDYIMSIKEKDYLKKIIESGQFE